MAVMESAQRNGVCVIISSTDTRIMALSSCYYCLGPAGRMPGFAAAVSVLLLGFLYYILAGHE